MAAQSSSSSSSSTQPLASSFANGVHLVPSTSTAESVEVQYARIVLPERGMCLAVRKACPLLFSGQGIGERGLLGDTVPRFLQCDMYAPVCRQVSYCDVTELSL